MCRDIVLKLFHNDRLFTLLLWFIYHLVCIPSRYVYLDVYVLDVYLVHNHLVMYIKTKIQRFESRNWLLLSSDKPKIILETKTKNLRLEPRPEHLKLRLNTNVIRKKHKTEDYTTQRMALNSYFQLFAVLYAVYSCVWRLLFFVSPLYLVLVLKTSQAWL